MPKAGARTKRASQRTGARSTAVSVQAESNTAHSFDIEQAVGDMPDNYLRCRDLHHAWKPYTVDHDVKARTYEVVLRCGNCKTKRIRLIGENGALLGNRYEYPDGYLVQGMGHLSSDDRAVIRLQSVYRMLPTVRIVKAS